SARPPRWRGGRRHAPRRRAGRRSARAPAPAWSPPPRPPPRRRSWRPHSSGGADRAHRGARSVLPVIAGPHLAPWRAAWQRLEAAVRPGRGDIEMAKRMLFIGGGAIGSYLGAFLARAGHEVTIVDPWPEQVDTLRSRGIAVTGPHDPFEARPIGLHVHELQRLGADFDIAFIAMKAYDTAWATWMALPHLKREGYVVSAQNCWNDPIVASIAGPERSVVLIMSK